MPTITAATATGATTDNQDGSSYFMRNSRDTREDLRRAHRARRHRREDAADQGGRSADAAAAEHGLPGHREWLRAANRDAADERIGDPVDQAAGHQSARRPEQERFP